MEILLASVGLAAGIYAYTYGHWLMKAGNMAGAIFAYCLAGLCVGLPVLKLLLD